MPVILPPINIGTTADFSSSRQTIGYVAILINFAIAVAFLG
jgi:hypothetical protein